jgi:hypothetical protein
MRPEDHVPGHQPSPESPELPEVTQELLLGSEQVLNGVIARVRAIDEWYAADFSKRLAELTNLLKLEMTKAFNSHLENELKSQAAALRSEYEERLYVQSAQWESERQSLKHCIADLQQRVPGPEVLLEINRVESELAGLSAQLRNGVADHSLSTSQLLQLRIRQAEVESYLRGLQSCLPLRKDADPTNNAAG